MSGHQHPSSQCLSHCCITKTALFEACLTPWGVFRDPQGETRGRDATATPASPGDFRDPDDERVPMAPGKESACEFASPGASRCC